MTPPAAGEFHCSRARRECLVRAQGAGDERFLQPEDIAGLERGQTFCGFLNVVTPYGAGIDEKHAIGTETLARGVDLVGILRNAAAAIRAPAELRRPKARMNNLPGLAQRCLGVVPE